MIAVPAIVWVAYARRRSMICELPPAVAGALAGVVPFLAGNVGHGFPSLNANWASQPVSNLSQAWSNFLWMWSYLIPDLLFDGFTARAGSVVLMLGYAIAIVAFAVTISGRWRRRGPSADADVALLAGLVLVACVLLFSFSAAGTIRGWTVRYVAPLYIVVPLFLGIAIETLWRWRRWLAIVVAAALVFPSLLLYGLPGTPLRTQLTDELRDDAQLRERLARDRVTMVYGKYNWVYHLNFDTLERVAGVPDHAAYDYYDYGDKLGTSPARWALIGGYDEVWAWANAAHARGQVTRAGDLWVFIAEHTAPNAERLLEVLRKHRS